MEMTCMYLMHFYSCPSHHHHHDYVFPMFLVLRAYKRYVRPCRRRLKEKFSLAVCNKRRMGEKKLKKREEKMLRLIEFCFCIYVLLGPKLTMISSLLHLFFLFVFIYVFRILSLCVSLSFPHIIMKNKCCKTTQGDH